MPDPITTAIKSALDKSHAEAMKSVFTPDTPFPSSVPEPLKIVAENYDPHAPLTPKQLAERERLLNYKFDENTDETHTPENNPKTESVRFTAYWEGYDRGVIDGKAGGYVMPEPKFTPKQARLAYEQAIEHPGDTVSFSHDLSADEKQALAHYYAEKMVGYQIIDAPEAPPDAKERDSTRFASPEQSSYVTGVRYEPEWNHILDETTGKWRYLGPVKHRFIYLSGETRQEPACK